MLTLFPKCRMFILKPFQDGFHDGCPEELRLVLYAVSVAEDAQGSQLPVIQHQR